MYLARVCWRRERFVARVARLAPFAGGFIISPWTPGASATIVKGLPGLLEASNVSGGGNRREASHPVNQVALFGDEVHRADNFKANWHNCLAGKIQEIVAGHRSFHQEADGPFHFGCNLRCLAVPAQFLIDELLRAWPRPVEQNANHEVNGSRTFWIDAFFNGDVAREELRRALDKLGDLCRRQWIGSCVIETICKCARHC